MIQDIVFSLSKFIEDRYLSRYVFVLTGTVNINVFLTEEEIIKECEDVVRKFSEFFNEGVEHNINLKFFDEFLIINIFDKDVGLAPFLYLNYMRSYSYDSYFPNNEHVNNKMVKLLCDVIHNNMIPNDEQYCKYPRETMNSYVLGTMKIFSEHIDGLDVNSYKIPLEYVNDGPYKNNLRKCYDYDNNKLSEITILKPLSIDELIQHINSIKYITENIQHKYNSYYGPLYESCPHRSCRYYNPNHYNEVKDHIHVTFQCSVLIIKVFFKDDAQALHRITPIGA